MSNSQFCIKQRQQEQQRLKKLLILGFAGSAALHGILAYALPRWSFEPPDRAEEPMELILVDKPKPKPEPKIESKPVVEPSFEDKPEPKPVTPPEPVKAQTPPPPVTPPEPAKAQTAPPKPVPEPVPEPVEQKTPPPEPTPAPTPKKVVTDPTPAPSQPIVSVPVENTGQSSSLSSSFTSSSSSVAAAANSSASISGQPGGTGSVVAANSAPPRPEAEANDGGEEGISCVSNCEPEYPSTLAGTEGSAGVKLTIDPNGNVIGAELADPDSDSGINRQALLAARQMQFSSPGDNAASVQVKIDFTVEGSDYDRARREEQERQEQAARERQEQEAAAHQQQLEQERQAQQEQLERERQAREQQQLQQQQESTPLPAAETQPTPEPLPALSQEELDAERLRKFRERIENYQ